MHKENCSQGLVQLNLKQLKDQGCQSCVLSAHICLSSILAPAPSRLLYWGGEKLAALGDIEQPSWTVSDRMCPDKLYFCLERGAGAGSRGGNVVRSHQ